MQSVAELNRACAISGRLSFREHELGGPVAELVSTGSRAIVALDGAQVLSWERDAVGELLWLSPIAKLGTGKAVRGGIPVCWPWFGPAPLQLPPGRRPWPQHGLVRTSRWQVVGAGTTRHGDGVWLTLAASVVGGVTDDWPRQAAVSLSIELTDSLDLALTTTNVGAEPIALTQALHTYFRVADITQVTIDGLGGLSYEDKLPPSGDLGPASGATVRTGAQGPLAIDGEVDRIYLEQTGVVTLTDKSAGRMITIAKIGSRSTVVWNPWLEKSARLGDMGADGYRRMVCVETANASVDYVSLAPGARHVLGVAYLVNRLAARQDD